MSCTRCPLAPHHSWCEDVKPWWTCRSSAITVPSVVDWEAPSLRSKSAQEGAQQWRTDVPANVVYLSFLIRCGWGLSPANCLPHWVLVHTSLNVPTAHLLCGSSEWLVCHVTLDFRLSKPNASILTLGWDDNIYAYRDDGMCCSTHSHLFLLRNVKLHKWLTRSMNLKILDSIGVTCVDSSPWWLTGRFLPGTVTDLFIFLNFF